MGYLSLVHRPTVLTLLTAAFVLFLGPSSALADTTTWTTSPGPGAVCGTSAMAADTSGNVYIYDPSSSMVQKYTGTGAFLGTVGPKETVLDGLVGSSDGGVSFGYTESNGTSKIVKYDSTGTAVQTIVVPFGGGNGQAGQISAIGTDGAGNLYVFDVGASRVEKFSAAGSYVTQWGSAGSGDGQFAPGPSALAVASDGTVYVFDASNRVQKFTPTGGLLGTWGSDFGPSGSIAVDSTGHVYTASGVAVREFDSSGRLIASSVGALSGVVTYGDDLVYTYNCGTVHRFELTIPDVSVSLSAASVYVGQPLTATATASVPFGSIASYAFDFGTGGGSTLSGPYPTATISYATPGSYQVTARVTSSRGGAATATATVVVTPRAPVNVSRPSILGTAVEGQRLTERHGVWSYGPITGYRYQWDRCDRGGHSCTAIGGARSASYVLTGAQVGRTIRVAEIAVNSAGQGLPAAVSSPTAVVKMLPRLSALSVSPRAFSAVDHGGSVTTTPQLGTKVHYKLNLAATVRFTIRRMLDGRQVADRCETPSRKNRNARRCTRYVTVRGSFTVTGRAGNNNVRFSGRLSRRTLPPGTYTLVATPTASTVTGRARTTTFAIEQ